LNIEQGSIAKQNEEVRKMYKVGVTVCIVSFIAILIMFFAVGGPGMIIQEGHKSISDKVKDAFVDFVSSFSKNYSSES